MAESIQHQKMAQYLTDRIKEMIPSDCWKLMQIDSPDSLNIPPLTNDGRRPDAYYQFESLLIIGEAKTAEDVDKPHSRFQYESYLKECSRFTGESVLILIVPLLEKAMAHNILQKMKRKVPGNVKIIVKGWIEGLT